MGNEVREKGVGWGEITLNSNSPNGQKRSMRSLYLNMDFK